MVKFEAERPEKKDIIREEDSNLTAAFSEFLCLQLKLLAPVEISEGALTRWTKRGNCMA